MCRFPKVTDKKITVPFSYSWGVTPAVLPRNSTGPEP